MILVIAVGFGAIPGVLAFYFIQWVSLAKFYAEDIEHVNKGPIEALNLQEHLKDKLFPLLCPFHK